MAVTRRHDERAMVTAEAAMVLPVLVALALALAWVVALGSAQARLVDAAREGARLAARDEPAATVQQVALAGAPDDASLAVARSGDRWVVTAQVALVPDLPLVGMLPPVHLEAVAVSAAEGVDP